MAGGLLEGNGAWGTAGNWSDGAAIPIANSDAIMGSTLNSDATDAVGDANDIDLDLLVTEPAFARLLGTQAAPIQTAADLVQVQGSGGFYFECDSGTAAAKKTDRIDIMAATANTPVEIGSASTVAGARGDIDGITILRGMVTLKGNIMFGSSAVVAVRQISAPGDSRVVIASGADTLPTLQVFMGLVEADSVITKLEVSMGAKHIQDTAAITTGDIGGILELDYGTGAPGTVVATTINVLPGGFLNLMKKSGYKTITTVNLYPGGRIQRHKPMHIFTNFNDYTSGAGLIES